jgi:DNA-binding transcriptional LysR family regulator
MEIRQFRYFIAVAEERHFGRAAEKLRIAQPGLSQQIKSLERLLGMELFVRDSRGVELTEAGQALLVHARVVVELADRAAEIARLAARHKKGPLRVGTPAAGMPHTARDLLDGYAARFPEVEVELRPAFTLQNLEALERRILDVAIVHAPFDAPDGSRFIRLGSAELLVAMPAGHRLASLERVPRSELLAEPFLLGPRHLNPTLVDHLHHLLFGEEHPHLIEHAETSETALLLRVAENGGLAAVWASVAELGIRGVVTRPVEEPAPEVEYGLIWFDMHASPHVSEFVDFARGLVQLPALA